MGAAVPEAASGFSEVVRNLTVEEMISFLKEMPPELQAKMIQVVQAVDEATSNDSKRPVPRIELSRSDDPSSPSSPTAMPLSPTSRKLGYGRTATLLRCAIDRASWVKSISPRIMLERQQLQRSLRYIHPDAPLRVVPFDAFCSHGSLPRSNEGLAVERSTLPDDIRIVFISHRWLRPWHTEAECQAAGHTWAGAAHPDDEQGTKFHLIVNGIKKLELQKEQDLSQVMIWLDYACIDQDCRDLKIAGIKSLLGYIANCDYMLIPSPQQPRYKQIHRIPSYGGRAWTRLEAFTFYIQHLLSHQKANIYYSSAGGTVDCLEYVALPYLYPSVGEIFHESDRVYVMESESVLLNVLHFTALGKIEVAFGPAMVAAAGVGDSTKVGALLADGISVDAQDLNGVTGLWSAARMGHMGVVEQLILADADLNICASSGYAPLHCAAHEGHADVWHALIDNGADINLESKAGITPQSVAQNRGHEEKLALRRRSSIPLILTSQPTFATKLTTKLTSSATSLT